MPSTTRSIDKTMQDVVNEHTGSRSGFSACELTTSTRLSPTKTQPV